MSQLLQVFEFICVYLDDLLFLTAVYWTDHLTKPKQVLITLQEKGLNFNTEYSPFAQSEMEYLGFWVAGEVARPTAKNV